MGTGKNTEMLSTKQLADRLKVSTESIRLWRIDGLPHFKLSAKIFRYDFDEVVKWRTDYMKNPKNGADGNGKK